jgi:hypothetical protein
VQRDLDAYARALRAEMRAATGDLVSRLDDRRPAAAAAPPGPPDTHVLAPVLPLHRIPRPRRGPDDAA